MAAMTATTTMSTSDGTDLWIETEHLSDGASINSSFKEETKRPEVEFDAPPHVIEASAYRAGSPKNVVWTSAWAL